MNKQYYLFGAGVNGYGVNKFFGNRIKGVIDNNPNKWGEDFCGYKIINYEQFLRKWRGETVIVSSYSKSEDVVSQLLNSGVASVYVAPLMQNGFWCNCEEIIDHFNMLEMSRVDIIGKNPFADMIRDQLLEDGFNGLINMIGIDEITKAHFKTRVFLTETIGKLNKSLFDKIELVDLMRKKPDYKEYIKRFKNTHKNERCFIVGNGPSLLLSDVEILKRNKETCFASNSIYRLFKSTEWRPDYYVVGDYKTWNMLADNNCKEINNCKCFFLADYYYDPFITPLNTIRYNLLPFKEEKGFSEDIADYVYSGGTITYVAMQIAAYMGFKEIYLLGVDCNNLGHFYGDVTNNEMESWNTNSWNVEYWKDAYKIALEHSKNKGIKIFNATRGGELEVFDRVNFDSLFSD